MGLDGTSASGGEDLTICALAEAEAPNPEQDGINQPSDKYQAADQDQAASGAADVFYEGSKMQLEDSTESLVGAKEVVEAIIASAVLLGSPGPDKSGSANEIQHDADDGYRYNKYGRKDIKGWVHRRAYYKCTFEGCGAKKHVQQSNDGTRQIVTYEGTHTHAAGVLQPRKPRAPQVRRTAAAPRRRQRAAPAAHAGPSHGATAEANAPPEGQTVESAALAAPAQVVPVVKGPAQGAMAAVASVEGGRSPDTPGSQRPLRKARVNARSASQMLCGDDIPEDPPRKKHAAATQAQAITSDGSPRNSDPASSAATCSQLPQDAPAPAGPAVEAAFDMMNTDVQCPLLLLALVAEHVGMMI